MSATRYCATTFLVAVFSTAPPLAAHAECTVDPSRSRTALALPAEALAIRNKLFLEICEINVGELADVTDPTLGTRLQRPRHVSMPPGPVPNPGPGEPQHTGRVLLAYLVDLDGSVRQVTVLESSGHKELDVAAVETWSHGKFAAPAKLDGRPVRALSYTKMPFTAK
jgi:TonB family protein